MNSTICSAATLIGIHVVVGGWKSHVFAIQNTKAAIIHIQDFHRAEAILGYRLC